MSIIVVVLEVDISYKTLVTIIMVIVILELSLVVKLLIIIPMVIVKDNNYLKFIASYIKDWLLLVKCKDYYMS